MAAAEKKTKKVDVETLDNGAVVITTEEELKPPLHVVEEPKPQPLPGDPDYDWSAEYPGERVYVYTVPDTAKANSQGRQSPIGLTIGMAMINEDRAPNPGEMEESYEMGGFNPMWLLLRCVSSDNARNLQKRLRPPEYNAMLRGWAKFAGIELSE